MNTSPDPKTVSNISPMDSKTVSNTENFLEFVKQKNNYSVILNRALQDYHYNFLIALLRCWNPDNTIDIGRVIKYCFKNPTCGNNICFGGNIMIMIREQNDDQIVHVSGNYLTYGASEPGWSDYKGPINQMPELKVLETAIRSYCVESFAKFKNRIGSRVRDMICAHFTRHVSEDTKNQCDKVLSTVT